jgi:hypothetical protein
VAQSPATFSHRASAGAGNENRTGYFSRVNLGKTEKRVFRVTPDTKCEGKLKAKARVTVKYVVTDDGETAELIIVRPQKK